MFIDRIPVYLVTGFLGSGKTTLLCRWLREPALKDAAVIVNEIGEVGYDDQLIAAASDTPSLIANACVCCTGLPGLEEALESLFWARLERRMPAFPSVVIETTGLADPGPVIAAFEHVTLLKERYHLAGVITTLSATASDTVLTKHAEARAQIEHADVLVITKTDLSAQAEVKSVRRQLQRANPDVCVLTSAGGDLDWEVVLQALGNRDRLTVPTLRAQSAQSIVIKNDHVQFDGAGNIERDQFYPSCNFERGPSNALRKEDAHDHAHSHAHANAGDHANDHAVHAHDAITTFVVITDISDRTELVRRLAALAEDFGEKLLRVKGWVRLNDGTDVSVQISIGNHDVETSVQNARLSTISGRRSGLTVISRGSPARAGLILSMPA
jgi:G3E family GTPase